VLRCENIYIYVCVCVCAEIWRAAICWWMKTIAFGSMMYAHSSHSPLFFTPSSEVRAGVCASAVWNVSIRARRRLRPNPNQHRTCEGAAQRQRRRRQWCAFRCCDCADFRSTSLCAVSGCAQWMAPEAMQLQYSTKSDVWMYATLSPFLFVLLNPFHFLTPGVMSSGLALCCMRWCCPLAFEYFVYFAAHFVL
jgi:hypothetical protein